MDKKKHRHVFVMRILQEPKVDEQKENYTGFLRIFFYDPDSGETYLEFYDRDDVDLEAPLRIGKNEYLFSEFTFQDPDTGELIPRDHTHSRSYPIPRDKEFDTPEGIKLCAELNLAAYEKAFKAWNLSKGLNQIPPVTPRTIGIMKHYERVVADCRQWYGENCPEFLPRLASASADASAKLPDKSLKDTEWLRANRWPDLRDRLYKEDRIPLHILRDAANEIPDGRPPSLGDKTLFSSFIGYVNIKKGDKSGPGSKRTAKVDLDEGAIILSRKRKKKK